MEEPRTRLQKIVLIALAAMAVIFTVQMFISHLFFRGVQFQDTLLRAEETAEGAVYTGKAYGLPVSIRVTPGDGNVTEIDYQVGMDFHETYVMEYPTEETVAAESGRSVPGIRIWKNGELLFEGGRAENQEYGWYDADGQWDPGITVSVTYPGAEPEPESLSRGQIFSFATGPEFTARGNVGLYAMMLLFSALVAVDAAWPRVLFYLRNCCDVRDPEPSDFYLSMQRIGWMAFPVLICIGYLVAAFQLP